MQKSNPISLKKKKKIKERKTNKYIPNNKEQINHCQTKNNHYHDYSSQKPKSIDLMNSQKQENSKSKQSETNYN